MLIFLLGEAALQIDQSQAGPHRFTALVPALGRSAGERLGLILHGQDPVTDRQPFAHRQILQPSRALGANVIVMGRLTPDHAAERDKAVEPVGRPGDQSDSRRNLECSGDEMVSWLARRRQRTLGARAAVPAMWA